MTEGSATEVELSVELLACPACGGAVPLGAADTVSCPYCRAEVPVPPAHRALRASEAEYTARRSEARALFRRLGKPPSWPVRALVSVGTRIGGGTLMWLLPAVFLFHVAACWAAFAGLHRVALRVFHVHLEDVVLYRYDAGALSLIGEFAGLVGSFATLIVVSAYARRRGAGLRELQAGLSARPPAKPGGPACCRSCGAPLSVAANAVAATCPYCRADNLVRIPGRWIGGARRGAQRLAASVETAARAFEEESRALRRSLAIRVAVVGFSSTALMVLIFGATNGAELGSGAETPYQGQNNGAPFRYDWRDSVVAPVLQLDKADARGGRFFDYTPLLGERGCGADARPLVLPAGACDAGACTLHWYVALRFGDAIETSSDAFPAESFVTLRSHVRGAPFDHDARAWGETIPDRFGWLDGGKPVRLGAPHDGWFELLLGTKGTTPGTAYPLCMRLLRAKLTS
jgi:predicted RNA-binding Zn-ribbon protein involved in translation (DUF1610 family)